jgi:hypothetical protein
MYLPAGDISVKAVAGKAGLDDFLKVPHLVFADDPQWIAPLDLERREHLSAQKNPYFAHAEAQLFVAYRDGRAVGRISAQHDRLRSQRYQDQTGQFGFIDAIDDGAVFAALIDAARQWLLERDLKHMQGPFSFSINEETGLLVEGFDTPPCVMMGHARPYYAGHLAACGLAKVKDVIAYDYDARTPLPRAMQAMVSKVAGSGDLVIRPISKKHLARDLAIIIGIFNDAWSDNWGFVPMTEGEITALGNNLKMLVSEGYIAIADWQGEPAAMAVSLPDINHWVRDLGGRLLPFGWAKLLWRMFARPPQGVRMPLMGVCKVHQSSPIGAALALSVIDAVRQYHLSQGTHRAELSWILEDNLAIRRIIEALGAEPYKTYRIYERDI